MIFVDRSTYFKAHGEVFTVKYQYLPRCSMSLLLRLVKFCILYNGLWRLTCIRHFDNVLNYQNKTQTGVWVVVSSFLVHLVGGVQAKRTASSVWQLMFLQSDGQVSSMSISEAQNRGYSLTTTAQRVVLRSSYKQSHAQVITVGNHVHRHQSAISEWNVNLSFQKIRVFRLWESTESLLEPLYGRFGQFLVLSDFPWMSP